MTLGTTSAGEVDGTFSASSTATGPLTIHLKVTDAGGNAATYELSTWIWYPTM